MFLVDLIVDRQLDVQQMQAKKKEEELICPGSNSGWYGTYGTPVQKYHLAVLRENEKTEFCLRFVAQWLVHSQSYISNMCHQN